MIYDTGIRVFVVVQFILGLNFLFFCYWQCMVTYDNEFETKEKKILSKDKIEPQHIQSIQKEKTF